MKFCKMVFVSLMAASQISCSWHTDIDKPLALVDENGVEFDDYCVAPLYARSYGVSFSPEREGGEWDGIRCAPIPFSGLLSGLFSMPQLYLISLL
jgi:hypothetical protein